MKLAFKEHKVVEVITFDVDLPDLPDGWVYHYDNAKGYFQLRCHADSNDFYSKSQNWRAVYHCGGLSFSGRVPLDVLRVFCEACKLFSDAIAQHGEAVAT